MSTSGNLDTLVERVIERAQQEAAAVVDRAGKAAERELHQAEEQCRHRMQTAEAAAREAAAQRKHAVEAEALQDERRAIMNAREEAVEAVFAEALRELTAIHDPAGRRALLTQLVGEGVRALGTDRARVQLNDAERQLAQAADFPQTVDGATITIDPSPIATCGGPIVTDESGRVIFENTFEARLERRKDTLRRQVAETLQLQDREEAQ